MKTDIKIIQIIRDPRAIRGSLAQIEQMAEKYAHEDLCQIMSTDAQLQYVLPSNRFAQLIYEDLIKNPTDTLLKLHDQLELKLSPFVIRSALRHTSPFPSSDLKRNPANSLFTYKKVKHNLNSWKRKLSPESIKKIQDNCTQFMAQFHYEPINVLDKIT